MRLPWRTAPRTGHSIAAKCQLRRSQWRCRLSESGSKTITAALRVAEKNCCPCFSGHYRMTEMAVERIEELEAVLREVELRTQPYADDPDWPLVSGIHRLARRAVAK
eukprot:GHVR01022429.1.p1 GENE.GHVR01022429.1~~GHVR01022429.1.p1  ORF type:complete len:107 (+),score=14.33 GHVR01022429.1:463-783(+)